MLYIYEFSHYQKKRKKKLWKFLNQMQILSRTFWAFNVYITFPRVCIYIYSIIVTYLLRSTKWRLPLVLEELSWLLDMGWRNLLGGLIILHKWSVFKFFNNILSSWKLIFFFTSFDRLWNWGEVYVTIPVYSYLKTCEGLSLWKTNRKAIYNNNTM